MPRASMGGNPEPGQRLGETRDSEEKNSGSFYPSISNWKHRLLEVSQTPESQPELNRDPSSILPLKPVLYITGPRPPLPAQWVKKRQGV